MINNLYEKYENAFIACMCLIVSSYANSFCDAIKFSSKITNGTYDLIWHLIKYLFDRPFLILAGCFSSNILYEYWMSLKTDWKHALFHYSIQFKILLSGLAISFIIWWINYEWWRNFFDKM